MKGEREVLESKKNENGFFFVISYKNATFRVEQGSLIASEATVDERFIRKVRSEPMAQ